MLTSAQNAQNVPLAERLRPSRLAKLVGQQKVIDAVLPYLSNGRMPHLLFWGPPGVGKTSMALAIAQELNYRIVVLNAVDVGAKELRELDKTSLDELRFFQRQTLVFIDEIHRLNRSQQDVMLNALEKGVYLLIGATTENPAIALNRAILSRVRTLELSPLNESQIKEILQTALIESGLSLESLLTVEALDWILRFANGDARRALNVLEACMALRGLHGQPLAADFVEEQFKESFLPHDKTGELHYDLISALIKSIRGSDVDASLYYLARLIKGSEDPLFIVRRLMILASEDIGNADPQALILSVATKQTVESIGMPEARIALSQLVCYLAAAPKSNRCYVAINKALELVEQTGSAAVPGILRSQPKSKDYKYPHDYPKAFVEQKYLPAVLMDLKVRFYEPTQRGFEKTIRHYFEWLKS